MNPDSSGKLTNDRFFDTEDLKSSLKKNTIRSVGALVASRNITYFIGMIASVILSRLLSPNDFGLVAMVTVITSILIEFGILRLSDATIQKENINHEQVSTLFWINVVLCSILALIVIGLSPIVAWLYGDQRLKAIVCVFSISFIFNGLSVQHLAILQRRMQFYKFAANQIVATITSSGLAIGLAINGWGYWAIVVRQISIVFITTIGAWILCPWRPGWPKKKTGITPMIKFGLNSFGSYFMGYLHRSLDKFLIGWKSGAEILGYYDRAYHLFVIPVNQLVYPLTSLAVASLSRLNNDPKRFKDYYLKSIAMLSFIGMPISAVLTLISNDLVVVLLGAKWNFTGKILFAFCPSIGMQLLYSTNAWIHLSSGNADRLFRWSTFGIIFFAISFLIGVQFGAIGVASAYSLSYYVLILPALRYAGRPLNIMINEIIIVIWKPFLSALFSFLSTWTLMKYSGFTNSEIFIRIITSVFFCITVYCVIISISFWSLQPFKNFYKMFREMLPI